MLQVSCPDNYSFSKGYEMVVVVVEEQQEEWDEVEGRRPTETSKRTAACFFAHAEGRRQHLRSNPRQGGVLWLVPPSPRLFFQGFVRGPPFVVSAWGGVHCFGNGSMVDCAGQQTRTDTGPHMVG